MISMLLSDVAKKLDAKLLGNDINFHYVSIDTRSLNPEDLFVAIKGPNFDGHDFVQAAVDSGAIAVVVDHAVETTVPQLIVEDTDQALIDLAILRRKQIQVPILSVTGSCGKTTA